jgi:transposase
MLLWQEYRTQNPTAYGYSRFCELYRDWGSRLSPTMRQVHPAGERLFVDYARQTVDIIDGATGEMRAAQIFVAVLGASSYTYADATATQTLPDWIGAHVRALSFIGGVPRQIVPDNPKVGVLNANWYEPGLNPPIRTSPPITAPPSCRRGHASHATRPKSKPVYWWSSAGSWPGSETSASSL